jgi:hypothetical protein
LWRACCDHHPNIKCKIWWTVGRASDFFLLIHFARLAAYYADDIGHLDVVRPKGTAYHLTQSKHKIEQCVILFHKSQMHGSLHLLLADESHPSDSLWMRYLTHRSFSSSSSSSFAERKPFYTLTSSLPCLRLLEFSKFHQLPVTLIFGH